MIDLSNEETLKSFENFIMDNLPNDAPKRELAEFVVTLFKNDMESDGTSFEEQCVKQLREFLGHDTQSFVSSLFKYIRNQERKKERRENNSPSDDYHSNRDNREDYHSSKDSRDDYRDDYHSSRRRYDEERYDDKYQDKSPNRRNKRDNYNNNNNIDNNNSNYKQGSGNKKYKNQRDNYDNNNNNNYNKRNNNFNNNPNNPNNNRMNNNYQRMNYNKGKFCREFAEKGTCHRMNCQYPHLNQNEIEIMRNNNNENQYHNKNYNNNNMNNNMNNNPNDFQFNKNQNEIQSNDINNQNNNEDNNNFNNQNFNSNLNNSENAINSDNPLDSGLNTNNRRNDGQKKKFQNNRNSLVVENIPRELNEIAKISEHFSKFGKIRNIKIIENKRKCIVDFSTNDQAFKAYRSSEAIMGNRFIKIRWNKNDQHRPNNMSNNQDDPYMLNQDQNNNNDEFINNNNNNNEEDVDNENNNNSNNLESNQENSSYQQQPSEESIKIAEYNKKKLNLINDILKMADEEKDPKKKEFLKQQAKELLQKTEITEKKRPIQEISETTNIPKKKVITETRPNKRRMMKLDNRCSTIKIENLPVVLSSAGKLFAHFKNYGTIEKVWIEGQDGFARFSTRGEAEYAFNNAFYSISGDQLTFSWHETKENEDEVKDETKDENENNTNENNDEESVNKEGNDSNEERPKVDDHSGSLSTNLDTSTSDLNPNEDKD